MFELTGSPVAVGTLAFAQLLTVTLFGLFAGTVIDRFDVRRLLLGGACGYGVLELALAPQQSLAAVCVLRFLTGGFYMLWGSSALATMQLAAPDHPRGQVAGLYFFAFQGGAPLGGLLAGWLTARGGTQLAFAVAGAVAVAVTVAIIGAAVVLAGRPAWQARPSRSFGF